MWSPVWYLVTPHAATPTVGNGLPENNGNLANGVIFLTQQGIWGDSEVKAH